MKETENMSMEIPYWEKYCFSIKEAAKYFGIGENKIRAIVKNNRNAKYVLWDGTQVRIKRKLFEQFVDNADFI